MTDRETILQRLAVLLAAVPGFPIPDVDEPEPTRWTEFVGEDGLTYSHALGVQDDTPESLRFARGTAGDEAGEELEFTPVIAYAVQVKPAAGKTTAQLSAARRAQRDRAVKAVADMIAADPTLGLNLEVFADVQPPARDDAVAFPNALPAATALIPVRTLYTGRDAAA